MKKIIFLTLCLMFASCGKEPAQTEEQNSTAITVQDESMLKIFYGSMTNLKVEVFYEVGSEPYTGTSATGKDYWNLFETNIKRILSTSTRSVSTSFATHLSEMNSFPDKNKGSWSTQEAEELFKEIGASSTTTQNGVLSIAFVSGYFKENDGTVNSNVIGIHITGTTHIIVFKDVIKSIRASNNAWVALYSEQSVLVHEVGHALGMVNNGLHMVSDHQDSDHGDHCINSQCVMYWLNEGKDGLRSYIKQYITTGSEIVFGDQCLQDADKLIQSYR